jgi:hypothetical protein
MPKKYKNLQKGKGKYTQMGYTLFIFCRASQFLKFLFYEYYA